MNRRLLALLVALVAALSVAGAAAPVSAKPGAQISAYLKARHSPLAGYGYVMREAGRNCKKHPFDGRLLAAITGIETSFATHWGLFKPSSHNAWSWGTAHWPNYRRAIAAVAGGLCRGYFGNGVTTIEQMGRIYAPVGASNDPHHTNGEWPGVVSYHFKAMGGRRLLLRQAPKPQPHVKPYKALRFHVSRGQRVRDLTYLLSGHSRYKAIHFLKGPRNYYGEAVRLAVYKARFRLGQPKPLTGKVAGGDLYRILRGKQARPLLWIRIAGKRVGAGGSNPSGSGSGVASITRVARGLIGIHEQPYGSNTSPHVGHSVWWIQQHTSLKGTGWPWCVATLQTEVTEAGYRWLADGTAGSAQLLSWGRDHGLLSAVPRPGYAVVFDYDHGADGFLGDHTAYVYAVSGGTYSTIEGNVSYGLVEYRTHSLAGRSVAWGPFFIRIPLVRR